MGDYAKLKHTVHDLKGMEKDRMPIRPNVTTNCDDVFDVTTLAD